MDVNLLIFIALTIIIVIIICILFLQHRSESIQKIHVNSEDTVQGQTIRRITGVRNVRYRMQENTNYQLYEEENIQVDEDNDNTDEKIELLDHKIGTKKRAKLAAKAEKKLQRETAERDREELKKQEQLLQKEKDKQAEKERAEELQIEETERKTREEKEKKEYEEYLKMKDTFNIEEEGYEQDNKEYEENLLQKFLIYIKQNKVLVLEDLAAHFSLKISNVVERIQELQANGNLTGVIDDRGKFIYISEDELQSIAKFVQQRGRISIIELAENSNNLINLTSEQSCNVSAS